MEREERADGRAEAERADEWLRHELEPTATQVARVVRGALADGAARRAPRRARWVVPAAAAATLVLVAVGSVWLAGPHGSRADVPAAAAGSGAGVPVLTNVAGTVELRLPPEPPVVRPLGGTTVFNRSGLVIAVVTDGAVKYMVIGGGT